MAIASWISQSPSLKWLPPSRQQNLAQNIEAEKTYALFEDFMFSKTNGEILKTSQTLALATLIAETADTHIAEGKTVLFSGQVQKEAEAFITAHPEHHVIHSCPAGAMLEMMDLFNPLNGLNRQDSYQPGNILAARLTEGAVGNVTAFVKDPHPNSTFRSIELNILMQNDQVTTINDLPKSEFQHLITRIGAEYSSMAFKKVCNRIITGYQNAMQVPASAPQTSLLQNMDASVA